MGDQAAAAVAATQQHAVPGATDHILISSGGLGISPIGIASPLAALGRAAVAWCECDTREWSEDRTEEPRGT